MTFKLNHNGYGIQIIEDTPSIRLNGTETNGEDLTLRENAGSIELYDETAGAVAGSWDLNPTLGIGSLDIATDTVTASGDGTLTTFTLAHSLGATPTVAQVQPTSTDSAGLFYVSNKTSTDIDVTYDTAPPSGTDNLTFDILTA